MKRVTLTFCLRGNEVLLGKKKEGVGIGRWNGFGGKLQEGETPRQAAVRELVEESCLVAQEADLKEVATIRFFFADTPMFECFVFLTHAWQGEPHETDEMAPQWFPVAALPLHEMWAVDGQWVPHVLAGERFSATVVYDAEGKEVREFTLQPLMLQ